MASQKEIEQIYDVFSEILRADLGDFFDYTCTYYNGNFDLTLEQAQKAKHEYILKNINFESGMRVLDIGCGWGPLLKTISERGGKAVGITISSDQARHCKKYGLIAYLRDWKGIQSAEFGKFDAVISVEAFDAFVSPGEMMDGKQDEIYRNFFELCWSILPKGGRLYLQTSVWGKNVPPYQSISLKAPKDSNEYLLALLEKFFPGSWPPFSEQQIMNCASGFKVIDENTNTEDYLHTIQEWARYVRRVNLRKLWALIKLVPRYLIDKNLRYQIECVRRSVFSTMYKLGIIHLARITFEKE